MIEVRQTRVFAEWRAGLKDSITSKRIGARLDRLAFGNFGDAKAVGDKVLELRLDVGPGFRIYFTRRGNEVVILLCGGDKSSQPRDIRRAKAMAEELTHDD